MPHSAGTLIGSDFTDKASNDPIFGVFKRCGFWTMEEAQILLGIAREIGGCWLDIGGLTGWTAAHLATAGCTVYSVDPMYANAEFRRRAEENLTTAGVRARVTHWACTSSEFFEKVSHRFNGIIIDGDHESPAPLNDAKEAMTRILPEGVILLHDVKIQAVKTAADALVASGWSRDERKTTHGVIISRRIRTSPLEKPTSSVPPEVIAPTGKVRGTDDRIIVSCDIGNHYAEEFTVTKRNCNQYCADAWRMYYSDYPEGCPTHEQQQYAFKIYGIERAIREGFRYILWMDSSLAPLASIEPLWKVIGEQGWYAAPQYQGITTNDPWRHWASKSQETLGQWCSDSSLSVFGITREKASTIPLALTGLVGLDMKNPVAARIWKLHRDFYGRGVFNGPHVNEPGKPIRSSGNGKFAGHVSNDSRVAGHRHDEVSLSFVLHSLGLKPMNLGFWTLESKNGFIGQFTKRFNIKYGGS